MPPKKSGAAAKGRANTSNRSGRAAKATAVEKAGSKKEKQPAVSTKGKKRNISEVDDASEEIVVETKPKAVKNRAKNNKARKIPEPEDDDDLTETELEPIAPVPSKKRQKQKKDVSIEIPETQREIPETQRVDISEMAMEDDEEPEDQAEELAGELSPYQEQASVQRQQSRSLANTKITSSDTDGNESQLRRRIGELVRQVQSLEMKHRQLKEIGVLEADRNFDRLQKQSEQRANVDKQLIASLKTQLASEAKTASLVQELQVQLAGNQEMLEELQQKLKGANNALAESKSEVKALSAKLVAVRSSAEPSNLKVPGSAIKNAHGNNRHLASAAEAAAQVANKKENLYGDLTGLLVCGVKRDGVEEVFSCVQTGRNGTLQFKLSIPVEGSDKLDDAQFLYIPQLDPARDKDLIQTLPDYLVEEITFPRLHAAKFYSRVVKALNERPEQ